jgi:endonuclease/exonuclease/phosphatase family metal-dependent hydrolase
MTLRMEKMQRNSLTALLVTFFLAAGCTSPTTTQNRADGAQAVTIMTFNVENLFDTRDDPGKDDRTYLPLEAKETAEHKAACAQVEVAAWRDQCLNWDWNEDILDRKMSVLAAAILQVNDGRGPDILALQEIENVSVLEQLRTQYLDDAGYRPAILVEGDDNRGIDVAFLTRLEISGKPKLHRISFDNAEPERVADTRGILEATFVLPDGTLLTGYAVHFPAPFHPTAMRVAAYRSLAKLRASLPADRPAFAAGDFNTTSEEDRKESMLDRLAKPQWTVVHEKNCRDSRGACRGTSYYARDDTWSFLDMILWAPAQERGARATWRLRENSVRVANRTEEQLRDDGTPARFVLPAGSGVSDHWPLHFTIEPT